MEEEFAVTFHAGDGRVDDLNFPPSQSGNARGDFVDCELMRGCIADNAALADMFASSLKLRLDEDDRLGKTAGGGQDCRQQERGGDEGDIHDQEGQRRFARLRAEKTVHKEAGVGAFIEADAGVLAEAHGDLAKAGIDAGDMRGPGLEEAICKAASGGADIQAPAASNGNCPADDRRLKLEATAADIALLLSEDADGGILDKGQPWLFDLLLRYQNPACEDEGAGSFAAGNEALQHH